MEYKNISIFLGTAFYNRIISARDEIMSKYEFADIQKLFDRKVQTYVEYLQYEKDVVALEELVKQLNQIYDPIQKEVNEWIEAHTLKIPANDADLIQLRADVEKAHDRKWIQQDHVWEFHNDGSITSTKGRDLYGMRSVFQSEPDLKAKFEWKLPIEYGTESHAIVETEEVALTLRKGMEALILKYKNQQNEMSVC